MQQQMLMEKLVTEARHYRSKEFLKALMAVCALVALADGELQVVERQRIFEAFARVPALRELDLHKAIQILKDYAAALRKDGARAKVVLYRKVRRMAGRHKRVRTMMRLAYVIVMADEVSRKAELAEFRHLCGLLGLEPDQVWAELSA